MTGSKAGVAFIIQVPFILLVYLLYLARSFVRNKHIAMVMIIIFIGYLSFLHFIRYPMTMFRKYTYPLKLERAGGISVSREQKEVYESLSSYLSSNITKSGKIAVIGYYPHIGFLTGQKNIFEDDEYIFTKLTGALFHAFHGGYIEKGRAKSLSLLLEDSVLDKIKKEKPEMVLFVKGSHVHFSKEDIPNLMSYIDKAYFMDKVFGPADIYGLSNEGITNWIEVYKESAL